jgi:hypothetical protein
VATLVGPGELSALSPSPVVVPLLTGLGWVVGLDAIVSL